MNAKWASVVILCVVIASALAVRAAAPATGWSTRCRIVEVYDGDTVVVEIRKTMRVRLLDCWAPEIRGGTAKTKAAGFASRDALKRVAEGKDGVLFIPDATEDVGDAITLGRVLGHLWVDGDSKSLSQRQVEAGHATRAKE